MSTVSIKIKVPMKGDILREIDALARSENAAFVVHKSQRNKVPTEGNDWRITHRATGFAVPRLYYETSEQALVDADEFNALHGVDTITATSPFSVKVPLRLELRLATLVRRLQDKTK